MHDVNPFPEYKCMRMKKILIVFGTRPEAIKMAPLVRQFQRQGDDFVTKVCVTAQHREMLDQVLDFFSLKPDFDLDLMQPGQDLFSLTSAVVTGMRTVLASYQPDYVFVHGDTTTTLSTSLAAFYAGIPVCHVEAGLRTYNKKAPFPEEMNRQLTGRIADLHFAPTETARENLIAERVPGESILVTGNTVIDALMESIQRVHRIESDEITRLKKIIEPGKELVLVTGHRRENFGQGFLNICEALEQISRHANVQVIYPVHLNPHVQEPVYRILGNNPHIHLIDPLPYEAFIWLMDKCRIVITDSGGIQEEAPSLGKPVLVMRETTERPEALKAGTVKLVGTDKNKIISEALELLTNPDAYNRMSRLHNPYGDGHATERIVEFLKNIK